MLRAHFRRGQVAALLLAPLILAAAACDTRPIEATAGSSSTDPSLTALVVTPGTLTPKFNKDTLAYTVSETNADTTVTVTPSTGSSTSTITVDGGVVASGTASPAIPLRVGSNDITIIVTLSDGVTSRSYTVAAVRAP